MLNKLNNMSLTAKIAIFMIVVNLCGIAALAGYTWTTEIRTSVAAAVDKWTRDTEQFASLAAGGIKWGKAEVVQDSYALYRDDPSLNLVQFAAFNRDNEIVDSWTRDGADALLSAAEIAALAEQAAAEGEGTGDHLGDGVAAVTVVLPKNAAGQQSGEVVTVWTTAPIYATAEWNAVMLFAIQSVLVVAAFGLLLLIMRRLIATPLNAMSHSIGRMQEGDFESEVPYQHKGDEIGFVARSLETFRGEFIAKQEESRLADEQRQGFEAERAENSKRTVAAAEAQSRAVGEVAAALAKLADGDFTCHLDDLGPDFETLVTDFNRMVDSVSATLADVKNASREVDSGSVELANSADTLASRTEQTAASLEETAAALHEMTSTVKESSDRAAEAGSLVTKTKQDAASSATVVREAITAMDRIQKSSSQIGQIISVIDEIAFQTNLLALNAGVEAARAGEAGQGFAVVAHEVRELAQRSANAAKEISKLIGESGKEVESGVKLVNQTAESLLGIEGQVNEITTRIETIIGGYREQSTGLDEINTAVVSMDQATQQNAAMVEETNAACQELRAQGARLNKIISRFAIAENLVAPAPRAVPASSPQVAKPRRSAAPAIVGNTALAAAPGDWEDF
ncbi:methyl-accepting chemotaxis protein [Oricola indica]|jgi:methyl-accepting chemotaxis protein|uniref:methyl-accepting chemotaxis protein n=1 Tax=Oricola indica TaxID=2872591 RepID=UPI001CC0BBA4|nr:methyl-accepting chemotaxis protein [Oricola indica]